jgi:hypothetical protein
LNSVFFKIFSYNSIQLNINILIIPIQSSQSTHDFKIQKNVILHQNPVHNEAVLELKNSDNSQLEVSDMNGKLVLKKSLINYSKNNINTNNLPKGVYLFKVGKSVTKVIKN